MRGASPLLSICIPTYHNGDRFRVLLKALISQYTEDVEIIIRDDSLNREIECIVNEYKDRFPIRYFHGEKKGLDVAILFLTQEARGAYVWWMGDDTVEDGGVAIILALLKQYPQISLLYLNSREETSSTGALSIGDRRFFLDRNEALETLVDMLGFISATIFKRIDAISYLDAAREYSGTAWVNLFLILSVLGGEGKFFYFEKPLIICKPRPADTPAWYDGFKVFALNFFDIVTLFHGRFKKSSIRKALARNYEGVWKGMLVYRAKGYQHGLGSSSVGISTLWSRYWTFPSFWISMPFLLIPRHYTALLYRLYKKIT